MKHSLKLTDRYDEAAFLERKGRFNLLLRLKGKTITAYLPNTARLEEQLIPGSILFVVQTTAPSDRPRYRVISSVYRDKFVLLDTRQSIRIVYELLARGMLPFSGGILDIKTGVRISGRRLDILVERPALKPLIVEVNTCTLCHNGVALFPDSRSMAAERQIEFLQGLASSGYETCIIFLIPTGDGRYFLPNLHTDPAFTRALLAAGGIDVRAIGVTLTDPVTVDLGSAREFEISYSMLRKNLVNSGSYLLVLENRESKYIAVGRLGRIRFEKGYYVYVGSGMNGVDHRIARHYRKKKAIHWHIDYITPRHMQIVRCYTIRGTSRVEDEITVRMEVICSHSIEGFGSSDSPRRSHLFYFPRPPQQQRDFLDLVLDFMTFC